MHWDTIHDLTDICRLVDFDHHIHPSEDYLTVDEYLKWIRSGLKIYVLKDKDDHWIGTYQIIPRENNEIYFAGFGIALDFQRKGYGQLLMDKIIADYSNQKITCKTRHDNVKMKNLLKKNNFTNHFIEIDKKNYWSWWSKNPEG